jgi:hypothetical protein
MEEESLLPKELLLEISNFVDLPSRRSFPFVNKAFAKTFSELPRIPPEEIAFQCASCGHTSLLKWSLTQFPCDEDRCDELQMFPSEDQKLGDFMTIPFHTMLAIKALGNGCVSTFEWILNLYGINIAHLHLFWSSIATIPLQGFIDFLDSLQTSLSAFFLSLQKDDSEIEKMRESFMQGLCRCGNVEVLKYIFTNSEIDEPQYYLLPYFRVSNQRISNVLGDNIIAYEPLSYLHEQSVPFKGIGETLMTAAARTGNINHLKHCWTKLFPLIRGLLTWQCSLGMSKW